MSTPANPTTPPEALALALGQITEVLKASGRERLNASTTAEDGYRQLIWALEKISKATLEWRDHAQRAPGNLPSANGMSPEAIA